MSLLLVSVPVCTRPVLHIKWNFCINSSNEWYSQVELDPNAGIFITMNPAGKGYGGRQKLPDNLKQLFRPVAMSKPDNEQIAEVILFSEGFKEAKAIGRKLVAVFNLSKYDHVVRAFYHAQTFPCISVKV